MAPRHLIHIPPAPLLAHLQLRLKVEYLHRDKPRVLGYTKPPERVPPNNRRPQNSRSPPSRSRRTVSGLAHPGIGGVVTQPRLPGHVEPLPVALPPQRVLIARGGAPKKAALASRRERAHSPSAFARQFKLFSREILVQYASSTRAHRIHASTHASTHARTHARTQASKQARTHGHARTHARTHPKALTRTWASSRSRARPLVSSLGRPGPCPTRDSAPARHGRTLLCL